MTDDYEHHSNPLCACDMCILDAHVDAAIDADIDAELIESLPLPPPIPRDMRETARPRPISAYPPPPRYDAIKQNIRQCN